MLEVEEAGTSRVQASGLVIGLRLEGQVRKLKTVQGLGLYVFETLRFGSDCRLPISVRL